MNGLQDTGTSIGNLAIDVVPDGIANGIYWVGGVPVEQRMLVPNIPVSDWSRNLFVHESGTPGGWDDTHGWSKFASASGAESLMGAWAARLAKGGKIVRVENKLSPGEWDKGRILIDDDLLREVSKDTVKSFRRNLHDTVYHEAFHGFVHEWTSPVSKWFGVEDLYKWSENGEFYKGRWGLWWKVEEKLAEHYGNFRGFLRENGRGLTSNDKGV